jgi:putative membrane protein
MSVLKRMLTAGGGLAVALMAAPMIALEAQVVAPGTNPQSPTTNPAPPTNPAPTPNPATPSQGVDPEIRNDLPFLREAAGANLMEVSLGRVAQTQASDGAVKEFGQRMVTDHSSLQQQLTTLTSSNGVGFSPALDTQQQLKVNRLQRLSGPEFDRAYMELMILDHQADVTHFEDQSRDADSPRVRDLAARSLPVLRQHLSLAQQVGRQVNVEVATIPPRRSKVPTQSGQVTNPSAQSTPQQPQISKAADRKFVYETAVDNMLETSMARLAEKKAESSAVKQFAQQIDADHDRRQNDWAGLASRNVQAKVGMGKHHRAKLDRLKHLSGRAFDRAYITTVVQNHKDYIDYFEKEGRSAQSAQVRQLVERDLPTLRSHFNQAKQVGAQVGADTSATIRSERMSTR